MNNLTKYAITTGALALALSADAIPSAAANPEKMQTNSAITSRTNSPHLAWAVVRVSISDRGDVEAMRIAYQIGRQAVRQVRAAGRLEDDLRLDLIADQSVELQLLFECGREWQALDAHHRSSPRRCDTRARGDCRGSRDEPVDVAGRRFVRHVR